MVLLPETRDRVHGHYLWFSVHLCDFYERLDNMPKVQAAMDELWADWYKHQPVTCIMDPDYNDLLKMFALCMFTSTSYTRDNPDKSTWGEMSHLTRFCIKMHLVLRELNQDRHGAGWYDSIEAAMHYAKLRIKIRVSDAEFARDMETLRIHDAMLDEGRHLLGL
ncbi:uncharacterized protein FIESC28_00893 [Fusarium coffeatum]|uniref:Uncharacterized protein n=1 Tax=Fusarium coffeatum TaxID=231269 RepID=A0A366SBF6_9HYPO|nr:uncharacterized protein FIESC28_00893 [Fusarium coffeatum]RBR26248.1 hypothetical protein FIESC28_00893 [Fusarium coffeatum]